MTTVYNTVTYANYNHWSGNMCYNYKGRYLAVCGVNAWSRYTNMYVHDDFGNLVQVSS